MLLALSKLNIALAEMANLLGIADPDLLYEDPRIAEAFVPEWLNALGADLDEQQVEMLRAEIRAGPGAPRSDPAGQATYLDRKLSQLYRDLDWEEDLARFLRPDQHARYLENVGDDPFFGDMGEKHCFGGEPEKLTESVVRSWARSFGLSERAQEAARPIAARYVEAALAIPAVPPDLEPGPRRLAVLRRTAALIEVQKRHEEELARDAALTDAERARAAAGSPHLLEVALKGHR